VCPNIFRKESLLIAGVTGDGSKTGELWQHFEKINKEIGLDNKISGNGFEIRIYSQNECKCHVGVSVSDSNVNSSFSLMELPASHYASFDVYVANGYYSENSAMDEWLESNKDKYTQKLLDSKPYVVEFYDERFHGNDTDSIVEIWIPIENK
jgi:predicted transcriptional regulator YdeE